ncbi:MULTISPECIES: O-antigen ligase family protein [Streptomyces]|uniref:O-antigen ligase domain-containing protein n=1 Tax=Streptomyces xinghaiensis TaxID=1038928 RepID=A0A3R7IZ92_9ACTN|nr:MULTISPECIES: O-antigen ligase family protein [Streptomyces]PQM23595.1 O-antigen ligase domain-containing protein [Streptomyces xinghaiensis]RKM92259.1 O-antigen ligase domain-containing protein [Streptomyces xinghaiensis]RNC70230.1 O-antigen ligase domain-containing protein [Streptomyces xinghaiensis]
MVPSSGRLTEEPRGSASDTAGVVVFGCCAAWALITSAGRDARPEGMLLALLAVAAGYAFGRIGGALLPVAVPAAAALAGAFAALAAPESLPGAVVMVPPGHGGAEAAQLALAAGTACCAAWAARRSGTRAVLRLAVAGIAVAALLLGSPVGCVLVVVVLLCSSAVARTRRRVPTLAGCALTAALVTGGTVAMAGDALPDGPAAVLEGRLTEHRVLLWRDALGLAAERPVLGVGPDGFGALSETARNTPGSDGKPHSAPLQLASEQGLPGVALLGAAFCWTLVALGRSPRSTPVVLTAGASLTVLAALAGVGNALSFPQVTVAAGLLAGVATSRPLTYGTVPEPAAAAAPDGALPAVHREGDGRPAEGAPGS